MTNPAVSSVTTQPRKRQVAGGISLFIAIILFASEDDARAQAVKSREEIERIVVLENLAIGDGVISGEAFNRSLRYVQVFIRYTWLWDDEKKLGKSDPGISTFYMLPKEIPRGGRLPFTFEPEPPLPRIAGGHFETTAAIAGFTEVIQQKK